MQRSIIIGLLVALVLTLFALQNDEVVTIRFFVGKVDGSLSLILLITVIIGVILGVIFSLPSINKQTRMIQNKNKEIDKLQSQIEGYRKQFGKSDEDQQQESQEKERKKKKR